MDFYNPNIELLIDEIKMCGKTDEEYYKFHKELIYSNHSIVNHDFILYMRYISNNMFIAVLNLFNYISSGNKAFYLKKDIKEFFNLVKSFNRIRQYIQKLHKKPELTIANTLDLNLTNIQLSYNIINITNESVIYKFTIHDLVKIFEMSLYNISSEYYLYSVRTMPKNPYTNLPFTLKNTINIYNRVSDYYCKNNKQIPIFFYNLKIYLFDYNTYFNKQHYFLLNKSITTYIDSLSEIDFKIEFTEMVNSTLIIKDIYCKKCYNNIQFKKIKLYFSNSLRLYILNSNLIGHYGGYEQEFIKIAIQLGLIFNKTHSKNHRRRVRTKKINT